jgi:tRNA nucleotidyltransferase (CCA-adding enzyme)
VGELFARSFVPFHRHEYVDSALEFLQEVVDAVPCYRYSFEPDQRAVDRILDFRD